MTALYGWATAAILALLVITAGISHSMGEKAERTRGENKYNKHLADDREAEAKAAEVARKQEQDLADALQDVSTAYEKGKKDAEAISAAVVTDLRSGNLRLRDRWQGCEADLAGRMPQTPPLAGQPDAASRDRDESAGRIVRAAAKCDAHVIQLQNVLLEERK